MIKKSGLLFALLLLTYIVPFKSQAAPYSGYPYLYEDFEEKAESAVNWANADYRSSSDGYANSAGSLEITLSGDGQMISVPVSLTAGETYNISCCIKPHDDVAVNYVNFIFWFKQKMEDGTAGKTEGFSTARINGVSLKADEWTRVTTQYTFSGQANINGKMEDAVGDGRVSIRFGGGTLAEINGKSEFSYNIDDFSIEPTFEESNLREPYEEVNLITNGDFSSELGDEWTLYNADAEITEDVPAEGCNAVNSLHITQTARLGRAYQNISIAPGTKYKLSFWAKGEAAGNALPVLEWDEGEEKKYAEINDVTLPFESDWQYYQLLYTTGADVPENVRFYIYTNKKLQKSEFYLTDIRLLEWPFDTMDIENPNEITTPEIREITTDGFLIKENSISVNAEYLGPNPQSGLVQLFKQAADGGWASIKTAEFNGEDFVYTFKPSDVGQNVKVRIVPMDVEGNVGGYRESELGRVLDTFEIQSEFTSGVSDGSVSARSVITNRSGQDRDIVCMLLLYDESNACIGSGYKHAYTSFGVEEILEVSVPVTGNCKKAKLFIWEGVSDVETSMIPVTKCVTLTE